MKNEQKLISYQARDLILSVLRSQVYFPIDTHIKNMTNDKIFHRTRVHLREEIFDEYECPIADQVINKVYGDLYEQSKY